MTAPSDCSPPQQQQLPLPSLEDYRLLVESIVDYGVFLLDPAGHIASWNRGAERIKGYAAHEIVGKHFFTFYPAEDVEAGKPTARASGRTPSSPRSATLRESCAASRR